MDSFFGYVFGALSSVALGAFLCRCLILDPRKHQLAPIVMHACFAVALCFCVVDGWTGRVEIWHAAVLAGASAWVWMSYPSWKRGVPHHYEKTAVVFPVVDKG